MKNVSVRWKMIILALITLIGTLAIGVLAVNRMLVMEFSVQVLKMIMMRISRIRWIMQFPCWMRCMRAMKTATIPMRRPKRAERIF